MDVARIPFPRIKLKPRKNTANVSILMDGFAGVAWYFLRST